MSHLEVIESPKKLSFEEKQDRLRLLKAKVIKQGREDLYFLGRQVLGYTDMSPKLHRRMTNHITNARKPKHAKFRLTLVPRGSLKSSCITVGFGIQQVIRDPDTRGLIASEEFETAKKFLAEIKGHMEENPEFIKHYGNLVGKKKWSESEIIVSTRKRWRKEPTITAAGIDVTKVGLHYDWIIIDDPHSRKNVNTPEQIAKVKEWYRLVLSLLDPGGILIVIGTRWHYDDLYGWLIQLEREREEAGRRRRFRILEADAFDGTLADLRNGRVTTDRLLWPERLDADYLLDQLIDQGPYIFSCHYRNRPIDDETAKFKKSWLRFIDPQVLTSGQLGPSKFYQVVDPARDEDGKDYTVISTFQVLANWQTIIREVRRGKWDEDETIDQMIRAYKLWKPKKIGFEAVAFQKTYARFIKREVIRKGLRLPIIELKPDTRVTKRMRILSLVPYVKEGFILFPGESVEKLKGNLALAADEMLRYPKVANDDILDTMAYLDQLISRPQLSAMVRKVPKNSFLGQVRLNRKRKGVLGQYNVRSA